MNTLKTNLGLVVVYVSTDVNKKNLYTVGRYEFVWLLIYFIICNYVASLGEAKI